MAAPETIARQALMTMISAEFSAEGFPVIGDKLHGSVGHSGTKIAVYPDRTVAWTRDMYVSEMELVVQFYGKYNLKVDPNQTVDPTTIETYADRFRTAMLARNPDVRTGAVWYFSLISLIYVDDPTGNKSRFEAHVTARGNNGALLIETGA